jgi:DnaJ like chaperone protein
LAIGGPIGALLGGVAGHYVIDRDQEQDGPAENQVAFTVGVIALGAKMAKADGVVTRDEVAAFRQVFQVPPGELENVARVFNLAKGDVAGYDAYAGQLAQLFGPRAAILGDVLDGLFHIAKADGAVHPAELEFLTLVARRFGFDAHAFEQIRARHVGPDERDPYLVLGLKRTVSDQEVKRAYRKLVRENHPDRLIARGVPEEFVAIANDRLATINDAYDRIQKERDLT